MPNYLPLFPLNLVAFPGEKVNLHIFEPRYRQLIGECVENRSSFGIPTVLDGRLPGYGTEMEVVEVAERYDDGRLDIRTRGLRSFRILDFENPAPGKPYARGDVQRQAPPEAAAPVLPALESLLAQLYKLLDSPLKFDPALPQPCSFQVGHAVGLSLENEYALLTIESETDRQLYLLEHLRSVLPVLENMERTKARIRMNGHFREFDALEW
jgi:hypothetical protein